MVKIPLGSVEELIVDVYDKTLQITTLDTLACTFDVIDSAGTHKYTDQAVQGTDGMRMFCLIDTTTWAKGRYNLFPMVQTATEKPRLGPFPFDVV